MLELWWILPSNVSFIVNEQAKSDNQTTATYTYVHASLRVENI